MFYDLRIASIADCNSSAIFVIEDVALSVARGGGEGGVDGAAGAMPFYIVFSFLELCVLGMRNWEWKNRLL